MELDHSNRLKDIAAEAATAFLDRGEALNTKIASLAGRADLNAEQATRVCEFANHAVWQALRKQASTVEFPIAEPEKVRKAMGHESKVAMVAYRPAPGVIVKTASVGKSTDLSNKTFDEWQLREERQNSQIAYERAKVAFDEAQDCLQGACGKFVEGLERFTNFCKEAAMDGYDLDDYLFKIATDSRVAKHPELVWKAAYCVKLAGLLADRPVTMTDRTMAALEPTALTKVAQDVEMENVQAGLHVAGSPVHYQNGRHQGWREIDTLSGEYGEIENQRTALAEARRDMIHNKSQMQNGFAAESTRAGGSV